MQDFNIDISYNALDIDNIISKEEYVDGLIKLLEPILQQHFKNDRIKQQIKPYKDAIRISCPYCDDSFESSYKKRGNIITEGKYKGFYKCFNCSKFIKLDQFFKDFRIDVGLDIVNYISNNLGNFKSISYSNKYDISLLLDIQNIEKYSLNRELIKNKLNLIEVKQSKIYKWLLNRLQFQEEKFLYNEKDNYVLILNLTSTGKILGAQKRLFAGFNKYLTLNLEKLYELLEIKENLPDNINTLSQLFNITHLNLNQPITVFEGPFDSFLFKNSVANTGANKKFPLDIKVRYWFDYDKTGIKKSIENINIGNSVFLWDKFCKDINLPYRKKWDLNDVKIYEKQNNIILPSFENYFSNDSFDLIDL